jgi:5-methyltetrahydrofolate--homocysteine methyltransferase
MQDHGQSPLMQALARRTLVFDGAIGTTLQAADPTVDDFGGARLEGWIDGLVLHAPHLVEHVHRSFLDVGCDAVTTCSFQASPLRLAEWGQKDQAFELNRAAAALARRLCDEYSTPEHPRFVVGSMGPSGYLPASSDPVLGGIAFSDLVDTFCVQAHGLVEGGADCIAIETGQDILEVKAALFGARAAFERAAHSIPIITSVSLDQTGRMLLGTDIGAVLTILSALEADIIGINCSTGPDYMNEPVRHLCSNTTRPISCIPNAGLPVNVGGVACYQLEPAPMAADLARFVREYGVSIVGGCCGTTPEHVAALIAALTEVERARPEPDTSPRIASSMRSIALHQQPPPLLIGERVNAQGSRAVKRLLLADDYDGVLGVTRAQVEGGAHTLDVCVALTERTDEAEQMSSVVKTLQMSLDAPLVLDSTDADVIRAGLEAYPGCGIVNSINLENGRARCEAVLPLVHDHGACVIALTIDEQGMAKTAERKLENARRIHDISCDENG